MKFGEVDEETRTEFLKIINQPYKMREIEIILSPANYVLFQKALLEEMNKNMVFKKKNEKRRIRKNV